MAKTRKADRQNKRFRIIVLGAGFSRPAGYPLAPELWTEIRRRADGLHKFRKDIESYIRFRRECDGIDISEDEVDFEDLCRFLDIEHFLGLRGSDTWSRDGNEGTIIIKGLMAQILAEATPAIEDVPAVYLEFARRLAPGDYVLTFNYDILLERSLEAVGKPYRLFPNRYVSIGPTMNYVANSNDEVVVLKLHGSIDWFDRTEHSGLEKLHKELGLPPRPKHPVFGTEGDGLTLRKLVEGPRPKDDPLDQMYRVREIEELYRRPVSLVATPWLLAPSTMKIYMQISWRTSATDSVRPVV